MTFGLKGSYRMTHRLHLDLELGGNTTFRDFDGIGDSRKLGDNLFFLTAGLSVTLGNTTWKRVIDARPYTFHNEWLIGHIGQLSAQNNKYQQQHERDSRVIGELKKILEIEGLLDTCKGLIDSLEDGNTCSSSTYPNNDYSGYRSLMARLHNRKWIGEKENTSGTSDNLEKSERNDGVGLEGDDKDDTHSGVAMWNDYLMAMNHNRECIGAPIYFFFRLNTTELANASQSLNIDEIARIAKKYDLCIRITGAADSATGSYVRNNELSNSRASFIGQQLLNLGIDSNRIVMVGKGGIADFTPNEANRHTKVELFFEP